jgi:hypothetical protein
MVIHDRSALSVQPKETAGIAATCWPATVLSDSLPSPVVRLAHLYVREGHPARTVHDRLRRYGIHPRIRSGGILQRHP